MKQENLKAQENLQTIAPIFIFRNMLEALFDGDDEIFINEVETTDKERTLLIECSNPVKMCLLKKYIGMSWGDGNMKLNIEYKYFNDPVVAENNNYNEMEKEFAKDRWVSLDIQLLFQGNPHFSRFTYKMSPWGPYFYCIFKKEVIQYFTDDTTSAFNIRSCCMEDVAKAVLKTTLINYTTEKDIEDSSDVF